MGVDVRNRIAKRAAKEIHDGLIVNLGIGIPTLVADHLPQDIHVLFHAAVSYTHLTLPTNSRV